jgi:hypothetical protein
MRPKILFKEHNLFVYAHKDITPFKMVYPSEAQMWLQQVKAKTSLEFQGERRQFRIRVL